MACALHWLHLAAHQDLPPGPTPLAPEALSRGAASPPWHFFLENYQGPWAPGGWRWAWVSPQTVAEEPQAQRWHRTSISTNPVTAHGSSHVGDSPRPPLTPTAHDTWPCQWRSLKGTHSGQQPRGDLTVVGAPSSPGVSCPRLGAGGRRPWSKVWPRPCASRSSTGSKPPQVTL